MAFSSSAPLYLDPPDWNQYQQAQQQGRGDRIGSGGGGGSGSGGHEIHQLQQGQALPRPDGGMQLQGLVRPASMADRARLAKLPQPEQALKCPRCDSINTKFCYFNNYSLSQPRHFCKTCRRYWTRGGALRNIPVGGGCRRNKRSKSTGSGTPSKSHATTSTDLTPSSTTTMASNSSLPMIHSAPHLPFMASLQLQPMAGADYTTTNVGLNFAGLNQAMDGRDYQVGGISSSSGMQQWRIQQIQQFPFFGGLDTSASAPVQGLFSFDGDHVGGVASSAGLISQMASVKMEDSVQGLNLRGQYLGAQRNEQYNWSGGSNAGGDGGSNGGGSGAGWMTNLSGFNPSSSGSLL